MLLRISRETKGEYIFTSYSSATLPSQIPTSRDNSYPKVGWINKGEKDVKTKDTAGKDLKEDEAGDYYNFEVAFAYQALPGQAQHMRSKNIQWVAYEEPDQWVAC